MLKFALPALLALAVGYAFWAESHDPTSHTSPAAVLDVAALEGSSGAVAARGLLRVDGTLRLFASGVADAQPNRALQRSIATQRARSALVQILAELERRMWSEVASDPVFGGRAPAFAASPPGLAAEAVLADARIDATTSLADGRLAAYVGLPIDALCDAYESDMSSFVLSCDDPSAAAAAIVGQRERLLNLDDDSLARWIDDAR